MTGQYLKTAASDKEVQGKEQRETYASENREEENG